MGSVNDKCLIGAKRKEFKELIRATDLPPPWIFQMHILKIPTGEGAPERVGGWGGVNKGGEEKIFPHGFGQSPRSLLLNFGNEIYNLCGKNAKGKSSFLHWENAALQAVFFLAFSPRQSTPLRM